MMDYEAGSYIIAIANPADGIINKLSRRNRGRGEFSSFHIIQPSDALAVMSFYRKDVSSRSKRYDTIPYQAFFNIDKDLWDSDADYVMLFGDSHLDSELGDILAENFGRAALDLIHHFSKKAQEGEIIEAHTSYKFGGTIEYNGPEDLVTVNYKLPLSAIVLGKEMQRIVREQSISTDIAYDYPFSNGNVVFLEFNEDDCKMILDHERESSSSNDH